MMNRPPGMDANKETSVDAAIDDGYFCVRAVDGGTCPFARM